MSTYCTELTLHNSLGKLVARFVGKPENVCQRKNIYIYIYIYIYIFIYWIKFVCKYMYVTFNL